MKIELDKVTVTFKSADPERIATEEVKGEEEIHIIQKNNWVQVKEELEAYLKKNDLATEFEIKKLAVGYGL